MSLKRPKKKFVIIPVRIEIKPSKVLKGEVGMFAARSLPKDSIVADASQYAHLRFVPWKEFKKIDAVTQRKIMDYCPADPGGFFTPPDLNYLSIAWHMNHSCNPTVGFNANDDFVAMRRIKKGEEITWDYGFDEANPAFRLKCTCGSPKCRKTITGNDWKELMKDARRYSYFSPKLKAFIKKQRA